MIPASLDVLLHDTKVGSITSLGGDRSIFNFEESYIQDPHRHTLGLYFKGNMGQLLTDFPPTQTQIHPWFSNLLPEGPLRTYLAENMRLNPLREYGLIATLGPDLPGAVRVLPTGVDVSLDESNTQHLKSSTSDNVLKFSLAGIQLKFSALAKRHGGLTIPSHGIGGDWIVKLPSLRFAGLAQNEFSMMTIAKMMGMDIPEFKLTPLTSIDGLPEGIDHLTEDAFAIRRFDRASDGSLIHIEDFAQVYGVYPERKYEKASARSIASVLWIETGEEGVREFIKRLVFNTLIGNADMHLKNWSLIYPDRIQARLAPGYDFVSTIPYIKDENAALKYIRTKKMSEFGSDELSYLAAKSSIPQTSVLQAATETVETFLDIWAQNKSSLPLSHGVTTAIDHHLTTLTLVKEN